MFAATDRIADTSADATLLVARVLVGWLFLSAGWGKLMNIPGTAKYLGSLGLPYPELMVWPTTVGEIAIGVSLILGLATRYGALFSVAFTIVATGLAHRYWAFPAAQQGGQYTHFIKNLAIIGGGLLLFITGAGRFSLDRWMRSR